MAQSEPSIAIIGGGIGGLSAALSLLRAGVDVQVYERARTISEVGAAVGAMGWCATCLAFIAGARRAGQHEGMMTAALGVLVSVAIILMKVIPAVPGSLTRVEWLAFLGWCAVGGGVLLSRRARTSRPDPAPTSPSGRGR